MRQSCRQSRVWGLGWKSWHSSTSAGHSGDGCGAACPRRTLSLLFPHTLAHASSSHLEAGVTAAVPRARAALGTTGLAAEGGVAQRHPVCGEDVVSPPGKDGMGTAWPREHPILLRPGDVQGSPNLSPRRAQDGSEGTYRHKRGSGSWFPTSPVGTGTCSSGCHPRRSRRLHMGCWNSHQYLGRRSS